MRYRYRFSKEAEEDVFDAYLWYEKQKLGLGDEFLEALDAVEAAITHYPTRILSGIR